MNGASSDIEALQQRAIATIRPLIPADAEERVAATVRQFNSLLREHIRSETGLRLSDEKSRSAVGVEVVDGFPDSVSRLIDRYGDALLWHLIMLQPKLGGVVEGLDALLMSWDAFENWTLLPDEARGSQGALERSLRIAHILQTLAVTREVFAEIKEIREDILGAYYFVGPRSPRIEIYWMAQALFAAAFGLRIEDLTIVTLAHELAHAYTHVGRDIDGSAWRDLGFAQSDSAVVEGLAQHYTAVVTGRVSVRAPGAQNAYEVLLQHQSEAYLAHDSWFEKSVRQRGEIVRFAMLQARTRGKVTDQDWRALLIKTHEDLAKR